MSRLINYIIEDIRNHTENQDFSDTIGIPDSEFLRFLNDAQYRIHSLITQQHPQVFLEEDEQDITRDQEAYSLPYNAYLGSKISSIEFTSTGLTKDYYPLRKKFLSSRYSGAEGDPSFYIRKNNQILLSPIPQNSTGKLRINFIKSIPRVDKRRGTVATVTLDSSTNTITTLTFNVSTESIDSTALGKHTRFTVVDAEGGIKMKNIYIDSFDASTGVATINSSFTYESGETIAVGDYIVVGSNSTTHTILDDSVERYLIAYCAAKIFHRDSSTDMTAQTAELNALEQDIVASYADISDDLIEIPDVLPHNDLWGW